jgi:hypothetical protein
MNSVKDLKTRLNFFSFLEKKGIEADKSQVSRNKKELRNIKPK